MTRRLIPFLLPALFVSMATAEVPLSPNHEGLSAEGFPDPRPPHISDPVIFAEADRRITEELGSHLSLTLQGERSWTVRTSNYQGAKSDQEMSRASEIVYETLTDLSFHQMAENGYLMLDLDRLASHSAAPMKPVGETLFEDQAPDPRQLVEGVHHYLQRFEYGVPPENYFTPDQILQNGYGDCDSMAVFMAAILMGVDPEFRPRFIVFPDHVMLAVPIPPERGDAAILIDGEPHVLVEVAGKGFNVGQVPRPQRRLLKRGEYFVTAAAH